MIERKADLWEEAEREGAAIVITTNGSVRKDDRAVMGRGCALEAKQRLSGVDARLGALLRESGNHVYEVWYAAAATVFSFPVKHEWNEQADPVLIVQSARELVNICDSLCIGKVVMPRPGCGNGRLRWEDVKLLLEPILDDRFIVVHKED